MNAASRQQGAEARLLSLGLELPSPPSPVANYVSAVQHERLLFVSGHGPVGDDGVLVVGRLGESLGLSEGRAAARLVGLGLLATLRSQLGSLDNVGRIVRMFGMVNCAPQFTDIPAVIDGCSDLLVEVFGHDVGRHSRSAVGMSALPFGIPVEVELVVAVGHTR